MSDLKQTAFPSKLFKLLAGTLIGIGIICVVIGAADLGLNQHHSSHYCNDNIRRLTVTSVPIWCGVWFIATGIVGSSCVFLNERRLPLMRLAFLILSMLCAVLFGPALLSSETYIIILRMDKAKTRREWLLPLFIAALSFIGIIFALLSTFFSCCCYKLRSGNGRVSQSDEVHVISSQKPRLVTPEMFCTETPRVEIQSTVSASKVSARSVRRENRFASYGPLDESQSSSSGEWEHRGIRDPNEPPRMWLPWQRGIPSMGRLAQFSVKWRNKASKPGDTSELS